VPHDLEADKHRVRVAQDVVAATRTADNPVGDAVLVIGEARKPPDARRAWGESLTDLMNARTTADVLAPPVPLRRPVRPRVC
jgi:hypothetical protein